MLGRTVGQKQLENPSVLCDWTGGDLLWALVTGRNFGAGVVDLFYGPGVGQRNSFGR